MGENSKIEWTAAEGDSVATSPDDRAHVEVFGHRQHWGRISEVEQFGAKMLRIDIPTEDPAVFESVNYGGAAIFSICPCTEDAARAWAARERRYRSPPPVNRLPPPDSELPETQFGARYHDAEDDE